LKREGIDTRRYYWPPIHMQKAYADSPRERDLPITERVAGSVLTPPLYSHMTEDEVRRVARSIAAVQANASQVRSALG
jgi:dTDP-4-amino-4,6-dideoxygalactose transaminase